MCGIAGYVGHYPGPVEAVLDRMARQLVHRGPDGHGVAVHGGFGLVHRRLAVIDRDGGAQPMWSAGGRWVLVYNGKVYNYRQLRGELTALGHTFTTHSDTEVVLAAWEQWGTEAFERFNGMFALAVADTSTGDVVLARDQFGSKPLYLTEDGSGRVAFASELRAVLAAAVVPRRADDLSIYRYLHHGALDDTERTFFAGVSRLLPGQYARITPDGTVHRATYTHLRHELEWLAAAPRPYDGRARDQVYAALVAAVRSRLVSDVPVGTALSGGLDESTVVATVDHLMAERDPETEPFGLVQQAFTVPFPDHPDRQRCIDAVARACAHRLAVHPVRPQADRLLDDLTDFIRTQEEPVISTAPYAQYCLMREASRHVTVLLDGLGADEMFGGHLAHHRAHLRELIRRRRYGKAVAEVWRSAHLRWPPARRRLADLLRGRRRITPEWVLDEAFAAAHAGERGEAVTSDLKQRLADDFFGGTLPALLRYGDRNSMRFSIEERAPFLDPPLLRLLWGLDDSAIISGGWNRRALRDATAGLLPRRVRRRWTRTAATGTTGAGPAWWSRMKDVVSDVLSSDSFGARPYFDQNAATTAYRAYLSGRASTEPELFWRLINVELWLREFVDGDPTVRLAVAATNGEVRHRPPVPAPGVQPSAAPRPDWVPHQDKQLVTRDGRWARFPLRAGRVTPGDDVAALAGARAAWFFTNLLDAPPEAVVSVAGHRWYLFCTGKVVAVSQGRPHRTGGIRPSWWARRLSRFVAPAPHGLADPVTVQLAIQQAGLARVLAASAASAAGRVVGRPGLSYRITGPTDPQAVAADGSTRAALAAGQETKPASLAPADPDGVARHVSATVRAVVPREARRRFGGTVVIDADEVGSTVLGHDTDLPPERLTAAFVDNPLGRGGEETPFAVVVSLPTPHR